MATRSKPKRRWILVVALLVIAAGGWWAYTHFTKDTAVEYQTATVTRGDLETSISAAGKLQPKETVLVGAQVSGQLEELLVEIGDEVQQGDLLARIDATIATTNVDSNIAQLKELSAGRQQQDATLALAKANAERAEMLYEADAISRAEYEAATADYAIAQGKLAAINAQIERQSSSLQAERATLEFTRIYAPMSGTVVSLDAVEGQTLNANQTAPTILSIADLSVMTVETDVSEADVLRVRPGQTAWFSTLGDSDRRWETTVRQVLPTPEVLNDVVLYKALLDIENPEGLLKTEMTAQVFFVTGSAKDAVLVPVAALRSPPVQRDPSAAIAEAPSPRRMGTANADEAPRDGRRGGDDAIAAIRDANPSATQKMVLVMGNDGTPRPQPVLIGLQTRTQAEVLYGLDAGQTVVIGDAGAAAPAGGQRYGPPGGFGRRG